MTDTHAGPGMRRRTLYLPAAAADELDAMVADIHHETRRPRHEVLAAALRVAVDRQDEVRARLAAAAAPADVVTS